MRATRASLYAVTVNDLSPPLTIAPGLSCVRFDFTYSVDIETPLVTGVSATRDQTFEVD